MRNPYRMIRITHPLLVLLLLLGAHGAALADGSAEETPLQPYGQAVEINPDPAGVFWISDPTAGEIRSLDPASSTMVIYPVGGLPSDARSNGAGKVWWANNAENKVSRLTIASRTIHTWTLPPGFESSRLNQTALDASGGLWLTDLANSFLFYLNPAGTELCHYTLPVIARSDTLLLQDERVWLADTVNGQIGYLDTIQDTFTWWSLPYGSLPSGLALDENNHLWWADPQQGELARLDPGAGVNPVTVYTHPTAGHPTMLAIADGLVWFTDQNRFGVLDPAVAQGEALDIAPYPMAANETCVPLAAPATRTIPSTPGIAEWAETTLTVQPAPPGWRLIALPEGANLQGIAIRGEETWLVDQGRQQVVKATGLLESRLFLPILHR